MGEDNLDPFSINLSALIISKQITHIFNLSISSGTVPKVWKKAHVIPLHKGGDKSDLNNYRPISKLPCLAKILESVTVENIFIQCFHFESISIWF